MNRVTLRVYARRLYNPNMEKNRYAVILAAGKGSRMKSKRDDVSKVSYPILGVPLLRYVMDALSACGVNRLVTILGFGGETSKKIAEGRSEIVWQKEQKGSGHAVMMAAPLLEGKEGETIVCCGDTPLLRGETLRNLFEFHEKNHNSLTILTFEAQNPKGYGRIVRENGLVQAIVEQKDLVGEQHDITEVNAGVYVFSNKELFEALKHITTDNAAGEYYLTDVISIFVKSGLKVDGYKAYDPIEMSGINDRVQLASAAKAMQRRINENLMLSGVTIEDPDTAYIGPCVEIGPDTVIKANTHLLGETKIGEECIIGPNSYVEDSTIGDYAIVSFSHIVESKLQRGSQIGPFARIRRGSIVREKAHIGNFVELKNTDFGNGSKAMHLSYLGDIAVGSSVNIGCGTIVANYDGVNKFHSEIGDGSFIGSGSTIISPIKIGSEAFVAAGSTITDDVQANDLAIARGRQVNKPGYAKALRERAMAKKDK